MQDVFDDRSLETFRQPPSCATPMALAFFAACISTAADQSPHEQSSAVSRQGKTGKPSGRLKYQTRLELKLSGSECHARVKTSGLCQHQHESLC